MYPGAAHSIWVTWGREGEARVFRGFYVNMEEPFRRTAIGFDTNDHMLDILVARDLTWQWKDEDVLADWVGRGLYSAEFAAAVRAEGERVAANIDSRLPPFDDSWDLWTPPALTGRPELPATWDVEPVALWDRRRWAYGDVAPP
jgi:predicted RNA-binding protein associated with RNAse of E/G family